MSDQNHTHTIVHSSAMYYQNLNVIHKSSKKLLKIKSVMFLFNTCRWYDKCSKAHLVYKFLYGSTTKPEK